MAIEGIDDTASSSSDSLAPFQTHHPLLYADVAIGDWRGKAMVDTGATDSYICTSQVDPSWNHEMLEKPFHPSGFAGLTGIGIRVSKVSVVQVGFPHSSNASATLPIRLFQLANLAFDIIIGLDWFAAHHTSIGLATRTLDLPEFGSIPIDTFNPSPFQSSLFPLSLNDIEPASWTREPEFEEIDVDQAVTAEELSHIPEQYHQYADVFSKRKATRLPPRRPGFDFHIDLKPGSKLPPRRRYPLNPLQTDACKKLLDDKLSQGMWRRAKPLTASPMFFVSKKGSTELRPIQDYRGINQITVKDCYSVPLLQDVRHATQGAQWLSKLDLRGAYNLLRVHEDTEDLLAFDTPFGCFAPLVMLFGPTTAPACFQRWVDLIFQEYLFQFMVIYLDDILIYSKSFEEHQQHICLVLDKLREHMLYASPRKCEFHKQRVAFLGYIITTEGVEMDPAKIDTIVRWPELCTRREIQAFLGFANFYRAFIERYSDITQPLNALLGKNGLATLQKRFKLPDDARRAFECLKIAFIKEPILFHWDPKVQVIVETDASNRAMGAILSQEIDGSIRAIAFFSASMEPAELNYDIFDKELLVVVKVFKAFKHWLVGGPQVRVISDHHNLRAFMVAKELNARQIRWWEFLSAFDFLIEHRAGQLSGKPDALSRRPDLMEVNDEDVASTAPSLQANNDTRLVKLRRKIVGTLLPPDRVRHTAPNLLESTSGQLCPITRLLIGEDTLTRDIKKAQLQLPQETRDELLTSTSMTALDDLLLHNGKLYVPDTDTLRLRAMQAAHDYPLAGHGGVKPTLRRLRHYYSWPNLYKTVVDFVATCDTCRRAKPTSHRPYGLLRSLEAPARPWASITMDRISQLPESQGYTSIWVVVDRFTKFARFVPVNDTITAEQLADLFIREIVLRFGAPLEVISDRGPEFASATWKKVLEQLKIERKLSTAYHPETDGQTERTNRTLEQYLRIFGSYQQDDWVKLLPSAEFWYNATPSNTTGFSPFEALYQYQPDFGPVLVEELVIPAGVLTTEPTRRLIQSRLHEASKTSASHFDRSHIQAPVYKVGDQVWLSTRHIRSKREAKKLDNRFVGPYKIVELISSHAVRLDLPASMRIHNVFHVRQLEPYRPNTLEGRLQPPPPPEIIDGEEEYEVQEVLDEKRARGKSTFLVRWVGYDETHNSWEPEEFLSNAKDKITHFRERKAARSSRLRHHTRN